MFTMIYNLLFILSSVVIAACQQGSVTTSSSSIPLYFKTSFAQPEPPSLNNEFRANFMLVRIYFSEKLSLPRIFRV